ncbi:hypothetical protein X777_13305 [Ooceraea biroi]|uniref:Uncharacterized protein n=1 Tax=Ooceraea biroi TaxID=2015173 RepID=A0A026WW30_OOCBI|nr:hypothetical protein X777_13305 [Ooceraea biroi]
MSKSRGGSTTPADYTRREENRDETLSWGEYRMEEKASRNTEWNSRWLASLQRVKHVVELRPR